MICIILFQPISLIAPLNVNILLFFYDPTKSFYVTEAGKQPKAWCSHHYV